MSNFSLAHSHRRLQSRRTASVRDAAGSVFNGTLVLNVALVLVLGAAKAQAQAAPVAAAPATPTAAEPAPVAAPPAAEPVPAPVVAEPPAAPAVVAEPAPVSADVAPAPKPTPSPYSLPWQLRPAAVATVLRSDTSFAFFKPKGATGGGDTIASMLLGSYKLTDSFAPMIRLGVVSNSPATLPAPAAAPKDGFSFINPVIGGTYLIKLSPELKLALFLGVAIPVGGGGGNKPTPATLAADKAGILARSAMDNAMFAINDFTVFPGIDLAFVKSGFTLQGEVTLLQLTRVKGDKGGKPTATPPVPTPNPDSSKTNFTMGLHAGYFVIPQLSLGLELRHQRWLSTPKSVKADEALPDAKQAGLRDTTTVAIGVRAHFKLSDTIWIRPGLSYSRGLDDPMSKSDYNILQLDVPVVF